MFHPVKTNLAVCAIAKIGGCIQLARGTGTTNWRDFMTNVHGCAFLLDFTLENQGIVETQWRIFFVWVLLQNPKVYFPPGQGSIFNFPGPKINFLQLFSNFKHGYIKKFYWSSHIFHWSSHFFIGRGPRTDKFRGVCYISYYLPDYWPVLSDKCHNNTTCPRSNFSNFLPVRDGRTKLKVEPCANQNRVSLRCRVSHE